MSKFPPRPETKQKLLSNQEFITALADLLAQTSGSIFLTQKQLSPQYASSTITEAIQSVVDSSAIDREVLFRATNRKDSKISTRVKSDQLSTFMEKYGEVCRAGMSAGLKKRDRKKTKKTK